MATTTPVPFIPPPSLSAMLDLKTALVSLIWRGWFQSVTDQINRISESESYLDSPGFSSGDFSGGGGTWSVTDPATITAFWTRRYQDSVQLGVSILPNATGSKVTTAGCTSLQIKLPARSDGLYQVAEQWELPCFIYDNSSTPSLGKVVTTLAFPDRVFVEKLDGSAFAQSNAGSGTGLSLQVSFRVLKVTP